MIKQLTPTELYERLCKERGVDPKDNAAFTKLEIKKRHDALDAKLEKLKMEQDDYE